MNQFFRSEPQGQVALVAPEAAVDRTAGCHIRENRTPVTQRQHPGVNIESESVAGEEDPGAALDLMQSLDGRGATFRSDASAIHPASVKALSVNPEGSAPSGALGTVEAICRDCGGTGPGSLDC